MGCLSSRLTAWHTTSSSPVLGSTWVRRVLLSSTASSLVIQGLLLLMLIMVVLMGVSGMWSWSSERRRLLLLETLVVLLLMILLLLLLIIELWLLLLVDAVILTWLVSLRWGEVGIDVYAYVYIACTATDVHSSLGRMWFLNIRVVDPIRSWVCWETSLCWMIARLVAASM